LRRLTHHTSTERTRNEIEQIYSTKSRHVHTSELQPALLSQGEGGIYQDSDGQVYLGVRVGNDIHYFAGYSNEPADSEALLKRYAFLMGAV